MELVIKERVNGNIIASGLEHQTVRVFEGNWYFDPDAVHMENLKVSERRYTCPYKGICFWIDLELPDGQVTRNVAWVYRDPKPGSEFIRDQIGFYGRATSGTLAEKIGTSETMSA